MAKCDNTKCSSKQSAYYGFCYNCYSTTKKEEALRK